MTKQKQTIKYIKNNKKKILAHKKENLIQRIFVAK